MQPIGIASSTIPSFTLFTGSINPETALTVLFTLIFIWWAVFTFVAGYHWLRFGRESWVAIPAMALHFIVSGWIFVFATGGFH